MDENLKQGEVLGLGNRLLRQRFYMDSEHMDVLFSEISLRDYMVLIMLAHRLGIHKDKVYLSEISKELNMSITQVSRLVQRLQENGYVYWEHDKTGTYIYLSEVGNEVLNKQQDTLQKYFSRIIERMGLDNFLRVLDLMSELDMIMSEEIERMQKEEETAEAASTESDESGQ